jgi:hypothetical protein
MHEAWPRRDSFSPCAFQVHTDKTEITRRWIFEIKGINVQAMQLATDEHRVIKRFEPPCLFVLYSAPRS